MGKFRYLPIVIVMITVEYLLLSGIVIYAFLRQSGDEPFLNGFFRGKAFENVSTSRYGKRTDILLGFFRMCMIGWFGGFAMIYGFTLSPTSWHYYTNWNIILITIYYGLACIASARKLYKDYYKIEKPAVFERYLALLVGSLYPVVASAALMITAVTFSLLSPAPTLWNFTKHLITSISFLMFELPLNKIPINWQELVWVMTWPLIYLFFIWPVVATDTRGWPYYFIETETSGSLLWYNILLFASILFFFIYFGLFKMYEKLYDNCAHTIQE